MTTRHFFRFGSSGRSALVLLSLVIASAPAWGAETKEAAQWRDFLATADVDAVYKGYGLALETLDGPGEASPELCRKNRDGLASAVEAAPVSAAVLDVAYRCAEALGDDKAAEKYAAQFAEIARAALGNERRDWISAPIPILGNSDYYAIFRASGLEIRYEWLNVHAQPRHLLTNVAVWDPVSKRERHYAFDYLDPVMELNRRKPNSIYPTVRRDNKISLVRAFADRRFVMGADMLAAWSAGDTQGAQEKVARLRPAAEVGGQVSVISWLQLCHSDPFEGCGQGAVDALLPQVEKGLGLPTVMLALAYQYGVGVDKDEAAAMKLLDKAGAIMGTSLATATFTRESLGASKDDYPAVLRQRLEALATSGDPYAATLLAGKAIDLADDGLLTEVHLERLRRHADAGVIAAQRLLGLYYFDRKRYADAAPLLRQAAEAGDSDAQWVYADILKYGREVPKDLEQAQRWRLAAAAGGDTDAMQELGQMASAQEDWMAAQEWFRSGAVYGNQYSAMALAYLYTQGHEGLDGDGARAVKIFESLDTPVSRRALGYVYLEGEGVPKDPAKAEALYRQDAEKGDIESAGLLGMAWLEGKFGKVDEAEGLRWLKKGLDEGDADTVNAYATFLYYDPEREGGRAKAMDLWRKYLPLTKDTGLGNNFAWALCTSTDATLRDGVEGLAVSKSLGEEDELSAGTLDTVASCYAAASDFKEAARLQAQVIAAVEADNKDDDSLPGMRDRLALYRAGKPYVEYKRGE